VTAALVAGLLAGYGIAVPIGPVGAYLIALGAKGSWRVAAAAAIGVASGDGLYASVAVLGGAALARVIAPAEQALRWLSAVVLLALAVQVVVSGFRSYGSTPHQPIDEAPTLSRRQAFLRLVAVTLVNPATLVYFAALVVGAHAGSAVSSADQIVFVAAVFVASASWQLLLATGGVLLGRALGSRRGRLVTALTSGALIVLLALRLVLRS
jgi:threonine/homoserine/homoserine lactone efflux protein